MRETPGTQTPNPETMKIKLQGVTLFIRRVFLDVRCKAFAAEGVRDNAIIVEFRGNAPDLSVLVYDNIAGHYTRCHSLTPWHIARIYAAARRAMQEEEAFRERV